MKNVNVCLHPQIHTDINECDGVNDCQQLCTNTEGSYSCSCTEGFDLADDGRRCTGKIGYVTFSNGLFTCHLHT